MKNLTEIIGNIGNALRSLYQMILVVNDVTMECHVIDYNEELQNISKTITDFGSFCEDLYENIHPEDRESFDHFTDPNHFPHEHISRFPWGLVPPGPAARSEEWEEDSGDFGGPGTTAA